MNNTNIYYSIPFNGTFYRSKAIQYFSAIKEAMVPGDNLLPELRHAKTLYHNAGFGNWVLYDENENILEVTIKGEFTSRHQCHVEEFRQGLNDAGFTTNKIKEIKVTVIEDDPID